MKLPPKKDSDDSLESESIQESSARPPVGLAAIPEVASSPDVQVKTKETRKSTIVPIGTIKRLRTSEYIVPHYDFESQVGLSKATSYHFDDMVNNYSRPDKPNSL